MIYVCIFVIISVVIFPLTIADSHLPGGQGPGTPHLAVDFRILVQ